MSKVVGFIVGAAMIVGGVLLAATPFGGPALLIALGEGMLTGGILTIINSTINLFAGSGAQSNFERQAAETVLQLGEGPRVALFGEAATAGTLDDAFNYGGTDGTDWEVLAVSLVDHRCEALVGFYVNDTFVSYTGDGIVPGYNGQLEIHVRLGTVGQTLPALLTTYGGWSASDRLRGVTYVVIAYKADAADAATPVWTGGRPRFLYVLKGKHCYDPRHDSTVRGGSGGQRRDNPATWPWTDNAEICRYNFDIGCYAEDQVDNPAMLLIGRGLSSAEAPGEMIFAAANLCDETVALAAGGSERRYRVGGTIKSNETFDAVEQAFAAAMGGIVIQPDGVICVEPGHAKSPVFFFTDDDILAGTTVGFSEELSDADPEWINTVIPRYVEPSQRWADHGAPIRRNSADVIADGGPREDPLNLRLVTSGTQAQRIGEIRRRQGRLKRRGSVTLSERFAEIEEGDIGVWTSARRTAGVPVAYRVESFRLDEKWQNALTLREMTSAVFGWGTSDEIADGTSAEANNDPGAHPQPPAGDWTATGGVVPSGSSSLPAIILTGAASDPNTIGILFEYALAGSGDWKALPAIAPGTKPAPITSVGASTAYDVGVTYFYDNGRSVSRRVLGPITTGAMLIGGVDPEDLAGGVGGTTYTWIAYANSADGHTDFTTGGSAGRFYIGIANNKPTSTEGTDPDDYTWSLMRGSDGVPGTPGADGTPTYTWFAYANSADGHTDFTTGTPGVRTHLGIAANKLTATEGTNPDDYTWSLIKGANGVDGLNGTNGLPGAPGADGVTLYTWIAYANSADGSADFTTGGSGGRTFIGIANNNTTATEGTNPADYTWSLIKGADGADGLDGVPGTPGADGTTTYTWFAYADSADGTVNFTTGAPGGRTYLGVAPNKLTETEGTDPAAYTWSLIKGANGVDGVNGTNGIDGSTFYNWVAYADDLNGNYNFTTGAPGGRAYQGVATNKTSSTESTNPADYVWGPYRGPATFGLVVHSNAVVGPDYILKTGGGSAWNSSAYSSEAFVGGAFVSFTAPAIAMGAQMVGLNTDPTTNSDYATIDYSFYAEGGSGNLLVYENGAGTLVGTYAEGDVLTISYDNKLVRYLKNGAQVRSVAASAGQRLYLDSSLAEVGVRVSGLKFGPAGSAGTDGLNGTNGVNGTNGTDGTTFYNWVAYADDLNGNYNFTTGAPGGRAYQGVATNKTSSSESTNPADYVWGPYRGPATFGLVVHANAVVGPDYILKTGGGSGWNSSAYSSEAYIGGAFVSFTAPAVAMGSQLVGLNTDPTTNTDYATIDYSFYTEAGSGDLYVYENGAGTLVGTYAEGDVLTISYDNKLVRYFKSGTQVRSVTASAGLRLYLDTSLGENGVRVSGLKFGPAGSAGGDGSPGAPGAPGAPGSPGAPGISANLYPPFVQINTTSGGAPKSGELARITGAFVLTAGGVLVSSGVTYSILGTPTGMVGFAIDAGTGIFGPPSSVFGSDISATIRANYGGNNYDLPFRVGKSKDGSAANAGKANVTTLTGSGAYSANAFIDLTLADGATAEVTVYAEYSASSGNYRPQIKAAYVNLTDSGSLTDISGTEVIGDTSFVGDPAGTPLGGPGYVTNGTGAAKVFRFYFYSRRDGGSGGATGVAGNITVEIA